MNRITRATTQILRQQLSTNPIKNIAAQNKLEILVDNKSTFVEYEKDGKTIKLLHTSIPDELQGHGLGHILAEVKFNQFYINFRSIGMFLRYFATHSKKLIRTKLATNPIIRTPNKFIIRLNGRVAYIKYERHGNVLHLLNTKIPVECRKFGLGHILAQRIFTYVAENDMKMKLVCEFLISAMKNQQGRFNKYLVQ